MFADMIDTGTSASASALATAAVALVGLVVWIVKHLFFVLEKNLKELIDAHATVGEKMTGEIRRNRIAVKKLTRGLNGMCRSPETWCGPKIRTEEEPSG